MTVPRCDRRLFHVMVALWLVLSGAASGHAQTRPAEPAARPSVDQDTSAANATGKANVSSSGGLLDVHLVTDEDIARRSSYAVKIGAITDAARPLRLSPPKRAEAAG